MFNLKDHSEWNPNPLLSAALESIFPFAIAAFG